MGGRNRRGVEAPRKIRYFWLVITALAVFGMVIYGAFLASRTHYIYDQWIGPIGFGRFDLVTGELVDPGEPDLKLAGLLLPSYVPHELPIAGIVRTGVSVYYIVFDREPLESGEFRQSERVEAGAIILLETPAGVMTSEEQEARIASAIEETKGRLGRVDIDGHVGMIGHGEVPQIRWWQGWRELNIMGHLTDEEFVAMAGSVQPFA